MPQSDHHLQYAGPGDTKPTLGQFNTSVDATVFSKIYMVCIIGKIVLEICLVPLIWLNILKSTNQNRECFSGGTTIKLIFCQNIVFGYTIATALTMKITNFGASVTNSIINYFCLV